MEEVNNFIHDINKHLSNCKIKLVYNEGDEYKPIKFIPYSEYNIASIECCIVDNYIGIEFFTYPLFRRQGFNLLMRYIVVLFSEYLSKNTSIQFQNIL